MNDETLSTSERFDDASCYAADIAELIQSKMDLISSLDGQALIHEDTYDTLYEAMYVLGLLSDALSDVADALEG